MLDPLRVGIRVIFNVRDAFSATPDADNRRLHLVGIRDPLTHATGLTDEIFVAFGDTFGAWVIFNFDLLLRFDPLKIGILDRKKGVGFLIAFLHRVDPLMMGILDALIALVATALLISPVVKVV